MNLIFASLVVVLVYLIYYYVKKKLSFFKDNGIPYVPPVPLLGNLAPAYFGRKHMVEVVKDIYHVNPEAKYVGVYQLMTPILLIRDLDLIKSVTIKNFEHFMDHKTLVDEKLDPLFGQNLFQMTGDKWKEARNLLTPAFTASKMKGMFDLMVNCAENFIKHIDKLPESKRKMLGTKDLFTRYTNDVIATCAFGISIDSLENPNNEFYVLGREATDFTGSLSIKFLMAMTFPELMKFFRIKLISDKVTNFFNEVIRTTIKTRDEQGITRPDMLQLMMDARGKTSDLLKLTVEEMTAQAFIFFFAGFETTSSQMCLISHELAINLDVQSRLQEEIDNVLKKSNGKPTYEQINDMPYLDAIFNESMRLHPAGALLDRICVKRFELPPTVPGGKPFVVEPGMLVWVPVIAIHHDPEFYDNPKKFDPERFIGKKSAVSQITNLGFGIGPRMCIGNRFAILETKILLFHFLAKYNLRPNEKTCDPIEYDKKVISLSPKGGFWLSITPRK